MQFISSGVLKVSFERDKYQVVRQAVNPELIDFCYNYFMIKRQAVAYMYQNKVVGESPLLGYWRDIQVPGAYSHYADLVMETLLVKVLPVLKEQSGLDLIPTYSYARVYQKGNILARHKDRESCEISATLNLGGDPWPIYIDPTGSDSVIDLQKNIIKPNAPEGVRVDLKPGDLLLYSGCELEHWREPFEGTNCAQVFLHYNHREGRFGQSHLYDKRPMLGLPQGIGV